MFPSTDPFSTIFPLCSQVGSRTKWYNKMHIPGTKIVRIFIREKKKKGKKKESRKVRKSIGITMKKHNATCTMRQRGTKSSLSSARNCWHSETSSNLKTSGQFSNSFAICAKCATANVWSGKFGAAVRMNRIMM